MNLSHAQRGMEFFWMQSVVLDVYLKVINMGDAENEGLENTGPWLLCLPCCVLCEQLFSTGLRIYCYFLRRRTMTTTTSARSSHVRRLRLSHVGTCERCLSVDGCFIFLSIWIRVRRLERAASRAAATATPSTDKSAAAAKSSWMAQRRVYRDLFSEREREFTFAICYRTSVCLSPVCLCVTFVRPTQAVQIFGNISTALGTLATRW